MKKNALTSLPTGGDGGGKIDSSLEEDISSTLKNSKFVEDPKRIKNFEREVSHYILTLCLKDPDEMKGITKDELMNTLKRKFNKNFRKMTQETANQKIKEAVNDFLIKRSKVLKENDWEYFMEEIMEERRDARYGKINVDFSEERKKRIKTILTESELKGIIDDTNKAKDIMRNLYKYVLNLELAKTLAKAGVFHENTLMPDRKEYEKSSGGIMVLHEAIDYSDFNITEDDINYLRKMSLKIYETKKSKHSVFTIEDEIDKHYGD